MVNKRGNILVGKKQKKTYSLYLRLVYKRLVLFYKGIRCQEIIIFEIISEARDRSIKAIAFAKLLRKDLEVAAEYKE